MRIARDHGRLMIFENTDSIDPITLEIWWSRLIAVADEAAKTLLRTAFSTIVRESNDFATVLMDAEGASVAECTGGIPAFAGIIPATTRAIATQIGWDNIREGDCFVTNDPWLATGHLPDITVVTPIFHQGRLVGFAGSAAHSPDVGGSLSLACRDVYEEGLRIPPTHLYRQGRRNEDMLGLFLGNVRLPEQVLGDLEAQVTANETCRQRTIEFLRDTGEADLRRLSLAVRQRSERAMREAIAAIPDGQYQSCIEADGIGRYKTQIKCTVTIEGDALTIDYAGSSAQVPFGTNCTLNYTRAYSIYPLKCALDPLTRRNEGSYRPITVRAPEGTILNARRPAPVVARHLTGHLLSCAVFQALSEVVPDRVLADSGGAPAMRVHFSGHAATGARFAQVLFASGGMGASLRKDGLSTTAFPTNSGAGSVEALESVAPLLVTRKEYRADSGGAGRHRGGLGQVCEVRNIGSTPVQVSVLADRGQHPARGLLGGAQGAATEVVFGDGRTPALKSQAELKPGESAAFHFAGGGGFGPPHERDVEAIREDLAEGLVSAEAALRAYAYVASPEAPEFR